MAHQLGERMPIHAALGAAGTKRVPPAVELEGVNPGLLDSPPMGFLDADQMA
jgi:hypothetical protein